MLGHRCEGGLGEPHLEKGKQEREGRFGPLVLVNPLRVQAVPATSGGGVVEGGLEIIAAEEPLEAPLRLPAPLSLPRESVRLEAGGERGLGFERLLIESSARPAPRVPAGAAHW